MAVAVLVVEGLYEGVRMLPWLLFPGVTEGGPSAQEERREILHHLLEVGGSREHYHLWNKIFYQGEGSGGGGEKEKARGEGGGRGRREKEEEEQKERKKKGRDSLLLKGCCEGRERGAGGPE